MDEGRNHVDLMQVIIVGLARKTQENIPWDRNPVIVAPLQAYDVLHRSDAFVHRPKLGGAQAFKAGLHAFHST